MAAKSSTCELNYCRYLPFFNLLDAEFNAVIGNWHYDFDTDLDLFNILPNPDKFDDKDPDNMLNCPHSNYYSLTQLNQFFDSTSSKYLVPRRGRRGGLMVSALVSGSSGPGSSRGRRHCVVFLGKTLYSHSAPLHPGV